MIFATLVVDRSDEKLASAKENSISILWRVVVINISMAVRIKLPDVLMCSVASLRVPASRLFHSRVHCAMLFGRNRNLGSVLNVDSQNNAGEMLNHVSIDWNQLFGSKSCVKIAGRLSNCVSRKKNEKKNNRQRVSDDDNA